MRGLNPSDLALLLGFPLLLGMLMSLLARLERWMLGPDEHAAAVVVLLDGEEDVLRVEDAVARRFAAVVGPRRV